MVANELVKAQGQPGPLSLAPWAYPMSPAPALASQPGLFAALFGVNLDLGIFDGALSAGNAASNSTGSNALRR
jgi:hypothetical protein